MPGCAAALAVAGFVAGFAAAWLAGSTHWTPLESGAVTAALTFVAVLVLVANDRLKTTSARAQVDPFEPH